MFSHDNLIRKNSPRHLFLASIPGALGGKRTLLPLPTEEINLQWISLNLAEIICRVDFSQSVVFQFKVHILFQKDTKDIKLLFKRKKYKNR